MTTPIANRKSEIVNHCAYCPAPAVSYHGLTINPPMCETHYDLSVLVEYLIAIGQPITIPTVQAQLTRALDAGGQWTFTPAHIPDLLPPYLAARKEDIPLTT